MNHGPCSRLSAAALFFVVTFPSEVVASELALRAAPGLDATSGGPHIAATTESTGENTLPLALTVDDGFASYRAVSGLAPDGNESFLGRDVAASGTVVAISKRYLSEIEFAAAGESAEPAAVAEGVPARSSFRLPPIQWRGTLGNLVGWVGATGSSSLNISQTMSLGATTYVWQPWFLQVGVNGSLSEYSSKSSGSSDASKGRGLSGGVNLDFFSQSRFPISAYFNAYQSSTKAADTGSSGGYNFGTRGSYRPIDGTYNANASYIHQASTQNGVQQASSDRIDGQYGTRLQSFLAGSHKLAATGGWSQSRGLDGAAVNSFLSLHGDAISDYYDDYGIHLNSSADFYTNASYAAADDKSTVSVVQVSTSGSWTPEDDIPLAVSGSAKYSQTRIGVAGSSPLAQSASGSLTASYRVSPQLGVSGNLGVEWAQQTAGAATSSVYGGVSASYGFTGEARKFGDFDYGWGGGASAGVTATSAPSAQGIGGGASAGRYNLSSSLTHTLSRGFDIGPQQQLRLQVSQGASAGVGTGQGMSGSLSTQGGLSYSAVPLETASLSASLTASDLRAFGSIGSNFQTITASLNGSMQLNRVSSVSASINGGFNRNGASITAGTTEATANSAWAAYGSASVSYQNAKAFGYRGLRYNANYSLSPPGWTSGDADAKQPWSHAFSQTFNYQIGRVSVALSNAISIVGPRTNASIQLNVIRAIGNY